MDSTHAVARAQKLFLHGMVRSVMITGQKRFDATDQGLGLTLARSRISGKLAMMKLQQRLAKLNHKNLRDDQASLRILRLFE